MGLPAGYRPGRISSRRRNARTLLLPSTPIIQCRVTPRMFLSLSPILGFAAAALAVVPAAIYDGGFNSSEGTTNSSILLRIGNGGAGQSGLVKG